MRPRTLSVLASLLLAVPAVAQENVPSAAQAQSLVNSGRFEEAAEAWKARADADANDAQAHFFYAYSLHMNGDLDLAHDAHIEAAKFSQFTQTALYNHACVHALRNEKDQAFKALEEAVAAGFNNAGQLESDSDMDNLRQDGRFDAILLRMDGKAFTDLPSLPAARRFDFYLGDWTMEREGEVEQYLSVTSAFDGMGLRVVSTAPNGETSAESLFVYDEKAGKWRYVWVNKTAMIVEMQGGLEGDAMVLRMVTENGKPKTDGRSVFRNVASDGFVYHWQETTDGGESWVTKATRTFSRRVAG